jgi:hypothetical protein
MTTKEQLLYKLDFSMPWSYPPRVPERSRGDVVPPKRLKGSGALRHSVACSSLSERCRRHDGKQPAFHMCFGPLPTLTLYPIQCALQHREILAGEFDVGAVVACVSRARLRHDEAAMNLLEEKDGPHMSSDETHPSPPSQSSHTQIHTQDVRTAT